MGTRAFIETICADYRRGGVEEWCAAAERLTDFVAEQDLRVEEIAALATAMADSGSRVDLAVDGQYCDIPSTGGPASLSTLLCPILVASAGVKVPKISASGSVAGGIDTMGLVPGFDGALEPENFARLVQEVGIAHIAQTASLCPADRALIQVRRERGFMANPALGAVSLLAKKLAVPGCVAVFDFRVGPTGNIGDSPAAAQAAAELFHSVASILGMRIGTVLTDNRVFPSSAMGRLESLHLLVRLLEGRTPDVALDAEHYETCVSIAAGALELTLGCDGATAQERVEACVASGDCHALLLRHLAAQGASEGGLRKILALRDEQAVQKLVADDSGYWSPPPLIGAKRWIKAEQAKLGLAADYQIGLRLRVSPGSEVQQGQVVAEVRLPPVASGLSVPSWLGGSVQKAPIESNDGVMAVRLGDADWRNG